MEILNENGLGKIYVCMTMVILDNQDFHVKCSQGVCPILPWFLWAAISIFLFSFNPEEGPDIRAKIICRNHVIQAGKCPYLL